MKLREALIILLAPVLTVAFLVTVAPSRGEAAAGNNVPHYTPDALQAIAINMTGDPHGGFTVRGNAAAHDWHTGTDIPSREDGGIDRTGKLKPDWPIDPATGKPKLLWPIMAYYKGAWYPSIIWYYDNGDGQGTRYRASNGYKWGTPERWAYVRWGKEVWDEAMGRMEVPDTGYQVPTAAPPKPTPKSLRYIVDGLKMRYTTGELNQAIDESQYNEPSEGAPEEGGAAPLAPAVAP